MVKFRTKTTFHNKHGTIGNSLFLHQEDGCVKAAGSYLRETRT